MNRLQVGIDFSQKKADFCLLFPDGQPLEPHVSFANSCSGYSSGQAVTFYQGRPELEPDAVYHLARSGEVTTETPS